MNDSLALVGQGRHLAPFLYRLVSPVTPQFSLLMMTSLSGGEGGLSESVSAAAMFLLGS